MDLIFLSRHHPRISQIEMVRNLGYDKLVPIKQIFPDNEKEMIELVRNLETDTKEVALAAPTWVHSIFWQHEYATIEFVQYGGVVRECGIFVGSQVFLCKGLWRYAPMGTGPWPFPVHREFIHCHMSLEQQIEMSGLKKQWEEIKLEKNMVQSSS